MIPSPGKDKHAIIIGAGIVGVATTLRLLQGGWRVTLIDREGPGAGASQGNAGVLASSSVTPVTTPGLLGKIPGLLLRRNQPLFVKWGYLPWLVPWLVRYLAHANLADTKRIARALAPIIGDSLQQHQDLARGTKAAKRIIPCDYFYAYKNRAHFEQDCITWDIRHENGFTWEEREHDAFKDYDPLYEGLKGFVVRLPGHGRIISPGDYLKDLAAHATGQGARLHIAPVQAIVHDNGIATGVRAGGETITADAIALTAGVWSGPLAKQLGMTIPMKAERGYHLELWETNVMPRAPVMIASGKFVITPMEDRLRLAGIVEFGDVTNDPTDEAFSLLERQIRATIPGLRWGRTTSWLGFRPAPVDSIPVIGSPSCFANVYMGFGHHHVGLTGGAKTGRILAALIQGIPLKHDLSVYSPQRFIN
ncbi:MAG: FAD-dependent oxidoreductase [Pseudomonadota bacterium]